MVSFPRRRSISLHKLWAKIKPFCLPLLLVRSQQLEKWPTQWWVNMETIKWRKCELRNQGANVSADQQEVWKGEFVEAVWWLTLTGTKGKGKDPVGQPFSERDKSLSSSGWACRWFLLSNTTLEKELHAFSFSWRANTQGKSSVVTHSRRWPQVRLFKSLPNES